MNKGVIRAITGVLVAWALLPKRASGSTAFADRSSYLGYHNLPRGVRNNNPGNLKITPIKWKGKIPADRNTDGVFEQFEAYRWGIRAMIKDIIGDMEDGKRTLRSIISEYAPSSENQTDKYIQAISRATGWSADFPLSPSYATMSRLIPAMIGHENGMAAITQRQFDEAWMLV